jgi:hypothetical protein
MHCLFIFILLKINVVVLIMPTYPSLQKMLDLGCGQKYLTFTANELGFIRGWEIVSMMY